MKQNIPDHKNFKNKLDNKNISNKEYKHALNVFKTFNCKNLMDYSILYLKTDVCHLADVFQKFSNFSYETYGLDCRYSYTLPGFSFQAMLKMTKIQLDLISNQDMYLFLMDSIRGGICQVNKKYSKADNKYTRIQHDEWKNKKINKKFKNKLKKNNLNKYLLYLDANNLYGYSMSQKLPYKNFKWSNDLTLNKIQTGIYEVDISIPKELHNKFKDYPLAPEIKSINNLSEYQKYLNNKLNIRYNENDKKLILDLLPKKNYKILLQKFRILYAIRNVKIDKVHKILTFDEKPFLKEYIDLNTELRKKAKNELEKDLFKLMNNAIFGKSDGKCIKQKSNVKLINNDPEKLLKLIKEPNFEHIHKISDKQVLVQSKPVKTKFNKPIYLGSAILETSKLHMYKFWYDYLKVKYGNNLNLIYTDTD